MFPDTIEGWRQWAIANCPKLAGEEFKVTHTTPDYNCIAWSLQITDRWIWPIDEKYRMISLVNHPLGNWPADLPVQTDLPTFIALFAQKKYELCVDGSLEKGYRKICIYGTSVNDVTHAARQIVNTKDEGLWTSKLGIGCGITHKDPYSVESDEYGKVLQFMKCKFP